MTLRQLLLWIVAAGIVVALLVASRHALYTRDSDVTKADLLLQIRDFSGYADHAATLERTIHAAHDEAFQASLRRRTGQEGRLLRLIKPKYLDGNAYRGAMYARLVEALDEDGDQQAAIALERFRAGLPSWSRY